MSAPSLNGQVGELGFTLSITRKDTGKVDTYQMIGKIMSDVPEPEPKPETTTDQPKE